MSNFTSTELRVIQYLKQQHLANRNKPRISQRGADKEELRQACDLNESAYAEIVARFEASGLVKVGAQGAIGEFLSVAPSLIDLVAQLEAASASVGSDTVREVRSRRIFISHAEKDRAVVDALVVLLQTGINVSQDDIFCTSLEGMGVPTGETFVEFIRSQLAKTDLVLVILSPHYYRSPFCLCELGAAWAFSHKWHPLLVPPHGYDELRAVLGGVHVGKLDERDDLNEMHEVVSGVIGGKRSARWEGRRDEFLNQLATLVESQDRQVRGLDLQSIIPRRGLPKEVTEVLDNLRKRVETRLKIWVIEKASSPRDADALLTVANGALYELEEEWKAIRTSAHRLDFPGVVIESLRECKEQISLMVDQVPTLRTVGGGLERCWSGGIELLQSVLNTTDEFADAD